MTAGFRNPLLLGLAIWFSKTEPLLRLCCLPASFQPAGLQLLFQFAVSVNFAFASCGLLRSSSAPSSDFRRFFSKGSGFYFSAAFPVNL
ncbi:hypothetical protein, partial [Corallococcus caeni]|uniref:hypothetical protein n=1 Tax=Corallococcus caeni TaxID=3082388 RepID=UPI0030C6B376